MQNIYANLHLTLDNRMPRRCLIALKLKSKKQNTHLQLMARQSKRRILLRVRRSLVSSLTLLITSVSF